MTPGLAVFLKAAGCDVVLFSRTSGQGYLAASELLSSRVLDDFDALLHLGWSSVPMVSETDRGIEEREDIPLAERLASKASSCSKPPQIVFFSTAAVYGNTGPERVDEEAPCQPIGRYAAAKLSVENILRGIPGCSILRITNAFGTAITTSRPQGIIHILIEAALSGKEVPVWGDGRTTKDYIASADVYGAVNAILRTGASGIFNVASEKSLSLAQLAEIVSRATGRTIKLVHMPRFAWDIETSHVSSQRLQKHTQWMPKDDPAVAICEFAKRSAAGLAT